MTYTQKARDLRQCKAIKPDGQRGKVWAAWNDPEQRCSTHAGRTGGERNFKRFTWPQKTKYPPCRCKAYQWPHRPGGGLCRWPDPPDFVSVIPAGTRACWRKRGGRY